MCKNCDHEMSEHNPTGECNVPGCDCEMYEDDGEGEEIL
jgi:hypothetical protein